MSALTMTPERFSVYQFFPDGSHERVRESVGAKEAVEAAHHYSRSVGAQIGTTRRVIITDSDDFTVFEWAFGRGVTFPPPAPEGCPPTEAATIRDNGDAR